MYDEEMLIQKSVATALPYAVLDNFQLQPVCDGAMSWRPDASGTLVLDGGHRLDVLFETGEFPTLASIKRKADTMLADARRVLPYPVLVAPYFSEAKQEYLRKIGLSFLDTAGNAWLSAPGVLVDRSGKKPSSKPASASLDYFSDKATLVLRLLFSGESLGIREMSALLEEESFPLSPGYISKTITALVEGGYAVREGGKARLVSRRLLLEDWVEAYRHKARSVAVEGWYYPEANPEVLARKVGGLLGDSGVLTDRSGACFVDAFAAFDSVDVLVRNHAEALAALNGLGAEPVERGANINLCRPVYPASSFFGLRLVDDAPIASDLQLYLDLHCQPRRGQEAADHLFKRRIEPLLKGGSRG